MLKICKKCGEELDKSMFNKKLTNKDNLRCECKNCQKKYRQENKERFAQYSKEYRETNREYIRGKDRDRIHILTDTEKEYQKEYQKEYRKEKEHKEIAKEYNKKWNEENREERTRYMKAYRIPYKVEHIIAMKKWKESKLNEK